MEFDIEVELSVKTNKNKTLSRYIVKSFELPYYKEDMHPDGLGYWQYFPYESAEENAINEYIDSAEAQDVEDYFLEELDEDEKIIEIVR